jgi:hypothetical protein
MPCIIFFKCRGRNIIASPPNLHLVLTMLLDSFQFVEPLECAVVSLIQSPIFDDRNIVTIELLCSIVEGLNGPGEDRSVGNIKLISVLLQRLAGLDGFLNS